MTKSKSATAPLWLQVFINKRMAVTLLLMFASSFPLPLTGTGTMFQVWLARDNVDIKTIGLLALVGWPYTLKFVWAPILDRYAPPFLSQRTGWILIFQILLTIAIASYGLFKPSQHIAIITAVALGVAFFSASQDIVIDAYRVDLLRPEERGAGASMVMIGGRLAFMASGAIGVALADWLPWNQVFLIMGACMLIGVATTLVAPKPEVKIEPPKSLKDAIVRPFLDFFKRTGAVEILLFVVFFKLADTLAAALFSKFLVELQFTNTEIGLANKTVGLVASLVGGVMAGGVVSTFGIYRSLWIFGILQAVSNLVFVGLANAGHHFGWMMASVTVEQFCGGMGTAAFVAYLMSLCERRFSATQFALLSSLSSLGRVFLSSTSGYLVAAMGWPTFYVFTAFLAIPGLVLLARIRRYEESPKPRKR